MDWIAPNEQKLTELDQSGLNWTEWTKIDEMDWTEPKWIKLDQIGKSYKGKAHFIYIFDTR